MMETENASKIRPDELPEEEYMLPGNRSCAGCGMSLVYRMALKALGRDTILTVPASCLTVLHGLYHKTSVNLNVIHTTFETTAASASGIVAALEVMGLDDKITVVGFAGDGGTSDIGIQGLSAAAERNTNFIATTCASYPQDIYAKFKKAKEFKGTRYIHILTPCTPGWGFPSDQTIEIGRLAVKSGVYPMFEIIDGKLFLSKESEPCLNEGNCVPVEEYLKAQTRFKFITETDIKVYEEYIRDQWDMLNKCL
jgi:pyruvate ferredoxin oxidoreductase beta subunit